MSDRVLRPRIRNGPPSLSLSEDRERVKYSAGRRRQKEVAQNVHNTVAQEHFKHDKRQPVLKKRVVFSSKRYTSDDLNGRLPYGQTPTLDSATPVHGILKQTPASDALIADLIDADVDEDYYEDEDVVGAASTPKASRKSRGNGGAPRGRGGRVSKHMSYTEDERTSPWKSASSSILAALALSVSPLARARAKEAEKIARKEETVRRAVQFYKSSGEWWNVFPKTDYTYSPMSNFHCEITPGVMTLPNMSRSGLHLSNSFEQELVNQRISPQRLNYSDSFGSDSDEVDDTRSRHLFNNRSQIQQHNHPSILTRVSNTTWTTIISILTVMWTIVRFVPASGYAFFSQKKKPVYGLRNPRYYSKSRPQESAFSRAWFTFSEFVKNSFHSISSVLFMETWTTYGSSRHGKHKWIIPILLLLPLLAFLGWWLWDEEAQSSVTQKTSYVLETASSGMRTLLTLPFIAIQSFLSSVMTAIHAVATAPLTLIPSAEKIGSILYDICLSPLKLCQSLFGLLMSLGWNIVSLFQMIFGYILSFKVNFWESSSGYFTSGTESFNDITSHVQSEELKALLTAALQKQEASILNKMSKTEEELILKMALQEKSLRAELSAKEGFGQQLNAKVASLQGELRRLRRRYITCCRGSEEASFGAMKEKLWGELKQLLASPEGLALLGAAATLASPVDKSPAIIPQFNDTEIRAWISSTFLDKDDFEKALANMTKHFDEELERRNAIMMSASAEEINAKIARQNHIHLAQLSKLKSELSTSFVYQSEPSKREGTLSTGETSASLDESRVQRIVKAALAVYDADKTGMADYALESQGGQVVSTRCTETYQVKAPTLSVFGVPLWYPSNSPRTVIQPGMHPGECWAFVGTQGYLVIQLSHRIHVKGFTYEHISPVLLPTGKMSSAPKEFAVYGLRAEGDSAPILLGDYHYLQNSTSMQYFPAQRSNAPPLQLIEIQVKSNHGNINYTCMYRFRVHGTIA